MVTVLGCLRGFSPARAEYWPLAVSSKMIAIKKRAEMPRVAPLDTTDGDGDRVKISRCVGEALQSAAQDARPVNEFAETF
jgi:hypothetical protein